MTGYLRKLKRFVADRARSAAGYRQSFALNDLDLKLLPFLDKKPGFFIEAGANDGVSQSNTAYLERYLGWRGFLIEPIPALAAKCRTNRPRAIVEQCALVPFGFAEREVEMTYCNLMSVVAGARGSPVEDARHVEKGLQFLDASDQPYTVRVAARNLTSILDQHAVGTIDLFSLDVEGFERSVLQGLDFDRYRPRLILVETAAPTEVSSILQDRYELVEVLSHHDYLYAARAN